MLIPHVRLDVKHIKRFSKILREAVIRVWLWLHVRTFNTNTWSLFWYVAFIQLGVDFPIKCWWRRPLWDHCTHSPSPPPLNCRVSAEQTRGSERWNQVAYPNGFPPPALSLHNRFQTHCLKLWCWLFYSAGQNSVQKQIAFGDAQMYLLFLGNRQYRSNCTFLLCFCFHFSVRGEQLGRAVSGAWRVGVSWLHVRALLPGGR